VKVEGKNTMPEKIIRATSYRAYYYGAPADQLYKVAVTQRGEEAFPLAKTDITSLAEADKSLHETCYHRISSWRDLGEFEAEVEDGWTKCPGYVATIAYSRTAHYEPVSLEFEQQEIEDHPWALERHTAKHRGWSYEILIGQYKAAAELKPPKGKLTLRHEEKGGTFDTILAVCELHASLGCHPSLLTLSEYAILTA
jgi:hypothetical protein